MTVVAMVKEFVDAKSIVSSGVLAPNVVFFEHARNDNKVFWKPPMKRSKVEVTGFDPVYIHNQAKLYAERFALWMKEHRGITLCKADIHTITAQQVSRRTARQFEGDLGELHRDMTDDLLLTEQRNETQTPRKPILVLVK